MPVFDLNDHTCKAVVINCMDFRIYKNQALHDFLKSIGINDYDLISVPGAGKAIIDFSSRQMILDAIKISIDLHHSDTIYIVHHRDCGAYGGSKMFKSPESEFEYHVNQMNEAEDIITRFMIKKPIIRKIFLDSENNNLFARFVD